MTDAERRLTAERDTARRRINAVCRAIQKAQSNGQTATDHRTILAALEADQ